VCSFKDSTGKALKPEYSHGGSWHIYFSWNMYFSWTLLLILQSKYKTWFIVYRQCSKQREVIHFSMGSTLD